MDLVIVYAWEYLFHFKIIKVFRKTFLKCLILLFFFIFLLESVLDQ